MKKNFKYAILSAVALVGAVSLTSCSSSDDVDVNPTFDGDAVKVQFALSIPGYGKQQTRMTDVSTQKDGGFRGIEALRFYPFVTTGTRTDGEYVVEQETSYGGASVITSSRRTPKTGTDVFSSYENTAAQDKWYTDVLVPTNTNAFLVYGKAVKSGTGVDFSLGKIEASYDKATPSDLVNSGDKATNITFDQVAITNADAFAADAAGAAILTQLNTIQGASGKITSDGDAVTWAAVGAYTDAQAATAGVTLLKDLYGKFTTASYAGSSRSVKAMLEDLKTTLSTLSAYNTTDFLVKDIYDKTDAAITAIGTSTFPTALGLPEGAAKLKCTNGVFSFDTSGNMIGTPPAEGTNYSVNQGIGKYVYPSELYYRSNTPIRVANKEIETTISTTDTWANVIAKYQSTDKAVNSTTRSIALVDPLQYAVGCLDTKVALSSNTTLKENTIVSGTGNDAVYRDVDVSGGLKLTGVLIGAQDGVNWAFKHPAENGTNVIYDKEIDANKDDAPASGDDPAVNYHLTSTTATHLNYTLVMETKGVTGDVSSSNTEVVYVALEFENDFADFCGIEGKLIPLHTKFYLIGKLDLNANSNTATVARKKVFEQDYTTTAEFTINSLKNAYNIVPDLRTPSLELGLSVDLTWTPGLKFTVGID